MVQTIKLLGKFWDIFDPWVHLPDERCGICDHKTDRDATYTDKCLGIRFFLLAGGCAHSPATRGSAGIAAHRQQSSRQQSSRRAGGRAGRQAGRQQKRPSVAGSSLLQVAFW